MSREKAIERVEKLRAMTVERGATPHEAAVARERAAELAARLDLGTPIAAAPAPARPARRRHPRAGDYATAAQADRRAPRSLRFVAFA